MCVHACLCMHVSTCATLSRLLPGVLGDSGQSAVHPLDNLSFPGCLSIGQMVNQPRLACLVAGDLSAPKIAETTDNWTSQH